MSWIQAISDWVLASAGEWWTYAITAVLCFVDGFFPPLPSESIVIAMSTMAFHGEGSVNLLILFPLACSGAFLGDNAAFWIGRLMPLRRWFSGERGSKILARAESMLSNKPAAVLISARFIPGYRVAINMTAGSLGMPWKRFALIDVASVLVWATFCLAIGSAAGKLFTGKPLLGMSVGIGMGIILGWVFDRIASRFRQRQHRNNAV
ncbi:MAG: DedA family protein [Propionibacteriaceae bacterium]